MSVSDPLIKDLKAWTRKLMEIGDEIEDGNEDFTSLCITLEKCFQKGLIVRMNSIRFPKNPEAWNWMEELGSERHDTLMFSYNLAIENVSGNPKVQTELGKLRLLIRFCLVKKCLHIPVELLVRTPGFVRDYYEENSILGDEILGEIFLSVLLQISTLKFKLNLRNASFLDDSWLLPEYKSFEFVPCKTLGISVSFIRGKALVIKVQENSVAAEDDKVEIGDVIDEMNGIIVSSGNQGNLSKIMKKSSGLPITLHVVKYRSKSENKNFYGPIVNLVRLTGMENLKKILKPGESPNRMMKKEESKTEETESIKKSEISSINGGYRITYCGSISTGTEGDVKQIEQAIWRLLQSGSAKSIPVRLECLEIGIKVTQEFDNVVILKQSYMEISSCGRTANIPDYFAFIAGETTCNKATKFEAYIFHHRRDNEVQTILQSLGQGFHRTHFAV